MHATHLHTRKAQQLQETTRHIEIYTDIYIFHQLSRCQNVLIVKRKLLKRKPKKKNNCVQYGAQWYSLKTNWEKETRTAEENKSNVSRSSSR